jgi:hypothetical protein
MQEGHQLLEKVSCGRMHASTTVGGVWPPRTRPHLAEDSVFDNAWQVWPEVADANLRAAVVGLCYIILSDCYWTREHLFVKSPSAL